MEDSAREDVVRRLLIAFDGRSLEDTVAGIDRMLKRYRHYEKDKKDKSDV